jgi:hypothetical protein
MVEIETALGCTTTGLPPSSQSVKILPLELDGA